MTARHQDAAVPLVARQGDELRKRRQRFGGDPYIRFAGSGLRGHLQRVPLMQDDFHLRKTRREIADHRRQDIAGLRVRRRDGKRARILALVFRADAAEILDFTQRAPGGGDHGLSRRRERCEPLAVTNEHLLAKLILELANLLADPGLRREQGFGRVGYVEAMVDDGAQIAELLNVHGGSNITVG